MAAVSATFSEKSRFPKLEPTTTATPSVSAPIEMPRRKLTNQGPLNEAPRAENGRPSRNLPQSHPITRAGISPQRLLITNEYIGDDSCGDGSENKIIAPIENIK